MLGSIINVGALLGTPLTAYMADKFGRKYSAMLVGLPYVITWALISVTKSYYVVLFALALSGLSAAGQSVSSIYISEIAQDSIRGSLTSSVNYALSILYIIMLIPLKESPCYLLKIGKEKEARESIAFYRQVDVDSKEVEREINSLRVQLDLNADIIIEDCDTNRLPEAVNEHQESFIKGEARPVKKKISAWQFLRKSESSKRALMAVIITMSAMVLMGSLVLQMFAESIFKEAIPGMRPNTCAILLAVDYLLASLVGASTLDKLGRKNLMTITSFIAGIFTIVIGTQLHLHWAPYWFTAVIIYLHSFIFNLGVAQVPLVLAAEVFLPEVRALGNSIALAFLWITNWIVVSTFFPLVEFFVGFLTSLTGFVYAWPSYTFQIYLSNDTYLDAPITVNQMSMLGSIVNIGGLIATPLCGYAVDKIGRKYSAMLFGLPYVISWALITVTTSFYVVLFAVGVSGFGAAGQAVSTVYISEIAQDSIRGALTSSTVYGFFFGLLMSYIFGGYMTYYNVLYIHLALSILYILMLIPLKESPCYLLTLKKEKEAAEAIAFYRQVDVSSKEVELEIQKIKLQLGSKEDKILKSDADTQEAEDLIKKTPVESNENKETAWQFLKRSKSSQRALVAVFTVMALTILMGSIALQVYAEPLFKEAVPTMHPNTCSILMAVTYLTAALFGASLLDKFGRRVRGLGNSVSMATMWIMNWVTLIIFNPIVEWWGLGSAFYFFSLMCFFAAAYSQFCLPETKGLSADEIQLLFLKEKRNDTQKV
ncbi:unnamed protein product [Danaus chrysippus]|uniref:(African queen) hypothetical protein n=1 Tax=Danaus chrysippus TaxID=151541 RepID=A0A8J2VTU1_9NEOP|nr:unnamed protein product [Danaus chrysippus]